MIWFSSDEFRCKCGRPECDALDTITPMLADRLDAMRARYAAPLIVTSGLRCASWNRRSGGQPTSEHLTGEAADLACVNGFERFRMIEAALAVGFRRLGIGRTFLHVGVSVSEPAPVVWLYPGPPRGVA